MSEGGASDGAAKGDPDTLRRLAAAARDDFDAGALSATGDEAPLLERAGDRVGRYVLEHRIGEGGMGIVWAAEQVEPVRRRVALKVVKLGMDTAQVLARFRAEQQMLALMEHPGIAAVHDGGSTTFGRPYFVMEYVEGESITAYCDRRELRLEARLKLFVQVCAALQHAHQKGVIHRDVKASNVLVTEVDSVPRPKVIDFGIAKVTSDDAPLITRLTQQRQIVGTIETMAPEQASGDTDIDTRADVYGLGVLLFELLCGRRPYELGALRRFGADANDPNGVDAEALLSIVRSGAPVRPSTRVVPGEEPTESAARARGLDARKLRNELAGELDWIVLRAIEHDRERRYASAASLADDVERYLTGSTVDARPPSRTYRLRKFVHRNRAGVLAAGGMLTLLVGGLVGTGLGLRHALRANEAAERQLTRATEAKRVLSGLLTGVAPQLARGKDTELLLGILDDTSRRLRSGEVADPAVASDLDLALGDGYVALGRFEQGLVHLERAVRGAEAAFDPRSAEVLRARRRRADALRLLERFEDAEAELRAVRADLMEALGPHDTDTLAAGRGLGNLLHRTGRIDEAHDVLVETVAAERAGLSEPERARASAVVALATLELFGRDDLDTASELFEEALALTRTHGTPGDPQELRCLEHLSQIDARRGKFDRAIERGREVAARYREIYGPDHRETLLAEGNLGVTMYVGEQFEASKELLTSVVERQRVTLGPDDPDTLWTEMQVALHMAREGRYAEAIEVYERAVRAVRGAGLPAFHERLELGRIQAEAGERAAARSTLDALLADLEPALGPEHGLVLEVRAQRATLD